MNIKIDCLLYYRCVRLISSSNFMDIQRELLSILLWITKDPFPFESTEMNEIKTIKFIDMRIEY